MRKEKILKKILTVSLSLCMSVSLGISAYAAKGSPMQTETTTADGKTQVTVAWGNQLQSLSPFQLPYGGYDAVLEECLEGLGVYDSNYKMKLVMAKEVTQLDEEGYKFNIEIYDYIHDSEGNPITIDDVLFSFEKADQSGNATQHLSKMKSATKVDDYNMIIEMKDNGVGALEQIMWKVRIVSQKAFEETGDEMATKLVGTGPYKIKEFKQGAYLITEKNENYWQTNKELRGPYAMQNVDQIKKVFITENSQREIALQTGTVDISGGQEYSSVDQLSNYEDIVYKGIATNNNWFLFPSSSGALADENLRKAVFYAVDEQAIISSVFNGFAIPCILGLDFTDDYNPEWENKDNYSYDPDKARELISEVGAEGTHLKMICNSGSAGNVEMMELVQAYLMEVGLDAEVVIEENATFNKDAADPTTYDLIAEQYGLATTIQDWRLILDEENWGGKTRFGFQDPELQELLKTAYTPSTHTQENMDILYDYIIDNAYMKGICRHENVYMWRSDSVVKDVAVNASRQFLPHCCTYIWNE